MAALVPLSPTAFKQIHSQCEPHKEQAELVSAGVSLITIRWLRHYACDHNAGGLMFQDVRVLVADGTSELGSAIVEAFATAGAWVGFCSPYAPIVARLSKRLILLRCKVVGLPVGERDDQLFTNWIADYERLAGRADIFAFPAHVTASGMVRTTYLSPILFERITRALNPQVDSRNAHCNSTPQLLLDVVSFCPGVGVQYETNPQALSNIDLKLLKLAPESFRIRIASTAINKEKPQLPNLLAAAKAREVAFLVANTSIRKELQDRCLTIKWGH